MTERDRPGEYLYAKQIGIVLRVYAATWEVDILSTNGGIVQHALVHGQRLPEVSTTEKPQYVEYGFYGAHQGSPWCMPIDSRVGSTRFPRDKYRYYEEFFNARITEDHAGTLEIRNQRGEKNLVVRIKEGTDEIEIEGTGGQNVRVRLGLDGLVQIDAKAKVYVNCETIELGTTVTDQVILGNQFMDFLNLFIFLFNNHVHAGVETGTGSTALPTAKEKSVMVTPQVPMTPLLLSNVTKTQ